MSLIPNIVSLSDHSRSLLSWPYERSVVLLNIHNSGYWLNSVGLQDHTSIGIIPLIYSVGPFLLVTTKTSNTRLIIHLAPLTYVPTHMFVTNFSPYAPIVHIHHISITIVHFLCIHYVLTTTTIHFYAYFVYQWQQ